MHCFAIILGLLLELALSGNAMKMQSRLPLPTRVLVSHRESDRAYVEWNQPNGVYYVSFSVSIRPPSAVIDDPEEPDQTFRRIRGLIPGTKYVVSIRGITDNGKQSPTKNYPMWSEPLPPSNLRLNVFHSIEVSLSIGTTEMTYTVQAIGVEVGWDESPSATSMSGYTVQISPIGGLKTFHQPMPGQEQDETRRVFVGLIPGEEYTFTVRTHVGPPHSLVYSSSISETIRIPPEKPFAATEGSIGATHAAIRTIGPLTGIYTSLQLELTPNHGEMSQGMPDPDDLSRDLYIFTYLTPNTEYTLNVYSLSNGVKSIEPITIIFTTAPQPPVKLRVTAFTDESVTFQWDHPSNLRSKERVEYIIEYKDMMELYEPGELLVSVDSLDTSVQATVRKLAPGTTYCFMVYTVIDGKKSEVSGAVQTTIPPMPTLVSLSTTDEGASLVVTTDVAQQCPRVTMSYSPPLPDKHTVEPIFHRIDEEIFVPGLTRDKKYTIHIRCVSKNVEGPPLVVSSTEASYMESEFLQDMPRSRLPCSSSRTGGPRRPVSAEFIAPDACCGSRPYHTVNQVCCGESIRRITDASSGFLCCIDRFYSPSSQVCCDGGIVNSITIGCGVHTDARRR